MIDPGEETDPMHALYVAAAIIVCILIGGGFFALLLSAFWGWMVP
jgi:hypothetical protein